MTDSNRQTVDFEQWSELAAEDPTAFEAMRKEMIEGVIDAASQRCQQRLRGLQWRIDQVRDHSPNPMAACISLSNMMWESFAGEEGLAETLNTRHFPRNEKKTETKEAHILPFPSRHE